MQRGWTQALLSGAQGHDQRQWVQTEPQEFLSEHEETLPVRVAEHRYRLPTEFVELPSLELFKSHLGIVLGNLL